MARRLHHSSLTWPNGQAWARVLAMVIALALLAVGFARVVEASTMALGDDLCRVGVLGDPAAPSSPNDTPPAPCCDFCLTAASALAPVPPAPTGSAAHVRLSLARRPHRAAPHRQRAGRGLGARGPPVR